MQRALVSLRSFLLLTLGTGGKRERAAAETTAASSARPVPPSSGVNAVSCVGREAIRGNRAPDRTEGRVARNGG